MTIDFTSILSRSADTIERPKPTPQGTYIGVIVEHEFGESSKKKTPYVRFWVKPIAAEDDVDPDALAENPKWNEKSLRLDFFLTEDALYRLTGFLEGSIGLTISGRTLAELIPETAGQSIRVYVTHEISERNPEEVYANISQYTSAE